TMAKVFAGEGVGENVGVVGYGGVEQEVGEWRLQVWRKRGKMYRDFLT
nr:hypothetical protein [Tanacetum cinerariifolium]